MSAIWPGRRCGGWCVRRRRRIPGRIVLVDSDGAVDVAAVIAAGEPQVVVRAGVVHIARLAGVAGAGAVLSAPASESVWRLGITETGTLENLVLEGFPQAEAPLGAGQVRVAVRAAGVNFRDVLIALGMYPDGEAVMGSEGAGVVVEVGAGVDGVAVGDRVMGLFPGAPAPWWSLMRGWWSGCRRGGRWCRPLGFRWRF